MFSFGLIDSIVPEPVGGAHWDYSEAAALLKPKLIETLHELAQFTPEQRTEMRIKKFSKMGFWDELPQEAVANKVELVGALVESWRPGRGRAGADPAGRS